VRWSRLRAPRYDGTLQRKMGSRLAHESLASRLRKLNT